MGVYVAPASERAFTTIWLGQLVSVAGSGLSDFALGLWVYQPLASLATGVLADRVFAGPTWNSGPLASSLSLLVGAGPGRGLGLFFMALGVVAVGAAALGLSATGAPMPARTMTVAPAALNERS
jgi:hypothetical protein